jgi:dihydroorotate dehydrogenase (NAD+) catalytic subunit
MLELNGIRLRNRLITSASLLGYGASTRRLIMYGLSPVAQWVPLERFGAVTTRTLTVQPREGHFSHRDDWRLREYPAMIRLYGQALRRTDAGWINAFGWCNIGIDRYFDEYFPRTHRLNRIISLGGFSADEFGELVETVNQHARPGQIAGVEFNVSCHNVNFPFDEILEEVLSRTIPRSRHPVIVKVSPDTGYIAAARAAARHGAAGITAINGVKALRLDPDTGAPLLRNRYGSLTGRAIKPVGLRVVAELRDAGIGLPIIATAGIRNLRDCREYFWAGADAVSVGSEAWLAPLPGYLLSPIRGVRLRRLIKGVERTQPPHHPAARGDVASAAVPEGPDSADLTRQLAAAAVIRGSFQLRSGASSHSYIDKYQFGTRPELLRRLARAIVAELPAGTDCVAGTALGAVPLAIAASLASGLPAVLVRPDVKDHGLGRAVEGPLRVGARVVLIEDVVTTGSAALAALRTLQAHGAQVTKVIAVVDREDGGTERLTAAAPAYHALFRGRDLGVEPGSVTAVREAE